MDARHFDALTRSLLGSRRRLLGVLSALPALVGLGLLEEDGADARGRRHRRRVKRHKHGRGRRHARRKKKKTCQPESAAQTCAGKCGSIVNNCKQTVACDPCVTCTGLTPADDLQAAIDAANDGATLTLCAGTWTLPATLDISRPITLVGAGAGQTILDGANQRRVLQITADVAVTLEALTLTRGYDDFGGAGIHSIGDLTLIDAEVTANGTSALGGGGGLISHGELVLRRTRVTANRAGLDGGGGILVNGGEVTLEDGAVIGGDTAEDGNDAVYGGGIFVVGGTVTLKNGSRVSGNTVSGDDFSGGGGIWLDAGAVTLEGGSEVTGNTSSWLSGGIFVSDGTLTLLANSRVSGNTSPNASGIQNSNGTATLEPGALVCDNVTAWQCAGITSGDCPFPADGICPV